MGHSARGLGGACHFNSLSVVEQVKVSQWKKHLENIRHHIHAEQGYRQCQ